MRNYAIGTGIIIVGATVFIVMAAFGVSVAVAGGITIAVATVGFVIQMVSAFSVRAGYEREHDAAEAEHQAVMARAASLPPEAGIALLLSKMR